MTINEKSAYIKGLVEGLGLNNETKEGKVILELVSLVSEMCAEISDLKEENKELRAYVEELDEDLGAIEEEFYLVDEEDEEEYEEEEGDDFVLDLDEDDDTYYEVVCPSCGEVVCFDESLLGEELVCPACGNEVLDCDVCEGECESCEGCPEE